MSIRILFLACTVLLASCGGPRVLSKEEMAPQPVVQKPVDRGPQWPGPVFDLDIPTELFGPRTAKYLKGDLTITANRYGFIEFAGERAGWAEMTISDGTNYRTIRLDEGEEKSVFSFKIKLLKAGETWDKKRSDYVPLLNVVVSR